MDAWLQRGRLSGDPPPARRGRKKEKAPPPAQKDGFPWFVRIFDISDIRNPKQVAAVQTIAVDRIRYSCCDLAGTRQRLHLRVRAHVVRQPEELAVLR